MSRFGYPCPDCRATNDLHDPDCRFEGEPWVTVEKAYVDILSVLLAGPYWERETRADHAVLTDGTPETDGGPAGPGSEQLPDASDLRESIHGEWTALHQAVLDRFTETGRVRTDGGLELLPPEEFREQMARPDGEPMRTIHERGSVPGCHDNAVFAMIAWYEMLGFTWQETRERTIAWLHESGTWARGGFEEGSPEQLVDDKRHVYERGYGWKEKATAAKRVIDASR